MRRTTVLITTCITLMLTETVNSNPMFNLSSMPPSNITFCPGRVTLVCDGFKVPSITWTINGSDFASYANYDPKQIFPLERTPSDVTSGLQMYIISVDLDPDMPYTYDVKSTLSGDVSLLRGSEIDCRRLPFKSDPIHITDIRDPPASPSSTTCSLGRTTRGLEVSIQWSPSFTSQYAVGNYRVAVNPATPSCPSDQMINPRDNYSCSGLVLGTRYSFSVSAINCGNQEGARDNITIQLYGPSISVLPVYDETGQLIELAVQLIQRMRSFFDKCSFRQFQSYTVVLGNRTRERVDQRMISCNKNICSISFPLSFSDRTAKSYFVRVTVSGVFGSTSIPASLNTSIPSSFNVSFSSKGCVTYVLCSYPMREGDWFFQYGHNSSYQDLSSPLSTSLNSPLQITVSDSATIHYYQVTIDSSSQVRGNFTSGEGARLTSANQGLQAAGVILLSVAIVHGVIITVMVFKKELRLSLGLPITGFVIALLCLVLWVAVGFHVGLQKNTCDPTWLSSREGLIISAHVFSDISFLIFVAAGIYYAVDCIGLHDYIKSSSEKMSFWHKFRHRKCSNQEKKDGET